MSGAVVWVTGLPAAGKTTLALALRDALLRLDREAVVLDGDQLRATTSRDLGFDREARAEQARRASGLAREHAASGAVAVVALVSPFAADRAAARADAERDGVRFIEVHVDPGLEECRRRDPKGLYAAARAGRLADLSGWDAPYEPPPAPEVHLAPPAPPVPDAVARVLAALGAQPGGGGASAPGK